MRKTLVFFASLVVLLLLSMERSWSSSSNPVSFKITSSPSPIHPGEIEYVHIVAKIDPGWHLYGLVPTPVPGPSPTVITVTGNGISEVSDPSEDQPTISFDPNFGKQVNYHVGEASFGLPLKVSAPPGQIAPTVVIKYQTCNSSVCLPPTTKSFSVPIFVTAGQVRPQYLVSAPASGGSLFVFLAAALGAGFLALLTPCVFPLIPITLTSFIKQANGDRVRLVRLALGYSIGIIVLYVAVGAVTSIALGAGGVDRLAANPFVNLFAFFVFVVFAFSFFEVIELRLPANLSALQSAAKSQGGLVQLVLLGIVFVFASFTCTAPFIGTLLVAAAGGSLGKPLLGMLVFACAFVSPFVLFSLFPQWISKIPKSGVWLARVKATLGFLELAASLKFLSNADLFWQWKILTQDVMLSLWALIFFCAALYIAGFYRFGVAADTEAAGKKVSLWRWLSAGLLASATVYCFWGLSGRPINPYLAAFLPPSGYGGSDTGAISGLAWNNDYSSSLTQAVSERKNLLIDFTGYTCTNCRLNEKQVFPDPSVQAELSKFVRVQLYTDAGPGSQVNESFQLSKFGDAALPLYGVIDPATGKVLARTAGVQSVDGFLAFLKSAEAPSLLSASSLWSPYSDADLADAQATGRPIIIDFTANWCTNCKAIERSVFPARPVADVIDKFSTYRCDMTNYYSPENISLQKRYSIVSLPAIVFLNSHGQEISGTRVTGLLTAQDFRSRMDRALLN